MLFGAHVSIAGGLFNAPKNAADIGCEVFQIFTRSPRGGKAPAVTKEIIKQFRAACDEHQQKEWYVHTPYFVNFASTNPRIKHGSISIVREELERASLIGAKYLMTHLGSYKDSGQKAGFKDLIAGLAKMLDGYRGSTQFLVEIAAGSGEVIGDSFEELAEIIDHSKLKKHNIGVCFDTQHAFASGYDLRNKQAVNQTLAEFDEAIGLDRLKMSHCNDSKVGLGSHKDRHDHIGEGEIGKDGFTALLNHSKLKNVNFVLETKHDKVKQDLKLLKKIRD